MSRNRSAALATIASMKRQIQAIENHILVSSEVSEEQVQVLSVAQTALEQTGKWAQRTVRWQERTDASIKGRPQPQTIRGVAIE